MAYNRKNLLIRILIIQEFYKLQNAKDVKDKDIYKIVSNVLCISESTFYKYLAVNVKKELRELEIDPDLILVENNLNKLKRLFIQKVFNKNKYHYKALFLPKMILKTKYIQKVRKRK